MSQLTWLMVGHKFQQLLTWISLDDYYKRHFDLRRTRVPHSGEWLFQDLKFQSWQDSSSSSTSPVLFCSGGGMFLLMVLLINQLVAERRSSCYYFRVMWLILGRLWLTD